MDEMPVFKNISLLSDFKTLSQRSLTGHGLALMKVRNAWSCVGCNLYCFIW